MLNRLRKAMDERDKGFTLIELLVVIIIIGILAAIAIPVFLNQRQKGVDAGLRSDVKSAATAVETYLTDNPMAGVATETILGAGAASGAAETPTPAFLADFDASPGNTIYLEAGTELGSYVITAENDASSEGAARCIEYDSENGGMQAEWVDC